MPRCDTMHRTQILLLREVGYGLTALELSVGWWENDAGRVIPEPTECRVLRVLAEDEADDWTPAADMGRELVDSLTVEEWRSLSLRIERDLERQAATAGAEAALEDW